MKIINKEIILEINRLHALASQTTEGHTKYERKAGKLLRDAQRTAINDELGIWIEKNLTVSVRQASEYIHKSECIISTGDSWDDENDANSDSEKYLKLYGPTWIPEAGHWYRTVTEDACYWVIPTIKDPNKFHAYKFLLSAPESTSELEHDADDLTGHECSTKWAEDPIEIEVIVNIFGLKDPENVTWESVKKIGLNFTLGFIPTDSEGRECIDENGRLNFDFIHFD